MMVLLLPQLSCYDINRNVEDLGNFQKSIDMSSCCSSHMMCRACFAPTVYELSCAACETCSHVGITEGKDRSFLVDALSNNEFEMSVIAR